jgi:signal transduction histidine kinase
LVLGLVGTTAHLIGRAKLRRKLELLEMQQAMESERQRIARDLHDDLGAGITEIMLLSELAKRDNGQEPVPAKEMNSQLSDITQKARQVATAMDEIVWTVDPKNDSLPDLASYLCDYVREFLRAANLSCRIDASESLPPMPLTAQQRHNLFMAVKEALNNTVKHSGATEVWLRILWEPHRSALSVTVEDNGRGFEPAARKEGAGNGLANMQTRMHASGGETEFVSGPGEGTKVRFTLPLRAQAVTLRTESLN